jgi:uncharacterized damage-inducible protein DinB
MSSITIRLTGLAVALLAAPLLSRSARAEEAKAPGVKGEMLFFINDAESKLEDLAAATPDSKFSWRPSADVRSFAEVFMHVATANYGIPARLGVKAPEGLKLDGFEKALTKKADIQKALKESFAHAKKGLLDASDADLDKPVELFGTKTTFRGGYMLVLSHAQEHMGQAVAYARMNNIVPPWTARRQASKKGGEKKTAKSD